MRSSCGPQLSPQIVNMAETMPSASNSRSSGCTSAKRLKAIGYSLSERSKKHTWLRRAGGTSARTSSASCPCGSMRRTPSPRAISCATIDRSSVDLPMPVLPKTAIWRRRSCSVSETGSPAALVPSRVCSISGRAPEREVMRRGGDRVLAYCGVFSDAGALPDVQRAHPDQSSSDLPGSYRNYTAARAVRSPLEYKNVDKASRRSPPPLARNTLAICCRPWRPRSRALPFSPPPSVGGGPRSSWLRGESLTVSQAEAVLRSRPTSRRSRVRPIWCRSRGAELTLARPTPRQKERGRSPRNGELMESICVRGCGVKSGCKPDRGGRRRCGVICGFFIDVPLPSVPSKPYHPR